MRRAIVAGLIVVALLPRLYQIGAYLPDYFHPDEDKEIRRAINLCRGVFDTRRVHKGGLFVVLAAEYGVYYGVLRATGAVTSADDFGRHIADDPSVLFLLSRLTVALLGTATVLLAFGIARRLGGLHAGLLAGLLLAAFPLHLELSRVGRLDVPLAFCVLLLIDLSLRALPSPTTRRMLQIAAVAGLTVATKTSGAPFLLVALPPLWRWLAPCGLGLAARRLLLAAAVASTTVLLFNHALVIALATGTVGVASTAQLQSQYGGDLPSKVTHYLQVPLQQLGAVVVATMVAGLGLLSWSRDRLLLWSAPLWLGCAALQIAALSAFTDQVSSRYVLPGELVVLLLSSLGAARLALGAAPRWRPAAAAVLTAVLLTPTVVRAGGYFDQELRMPTSVAAKSWVERHIPQGAGFALEGFDVFPSMGMPALPYTDAAFGEGIDRVARVDPGKAEILRRYFRPAPPGAGYYVTLYNCGRRSQVPSVEELWSNGIRYVVLRRLQPLPSPATDFGRRYRQLAALCDRHGTPLKSFSPRTGDLRGADLVLYDLGTGGPEARLAPCRLAGRSDP